LQGIGGSMIFATGIAILTAVYPEEERGKVIGINIAVTYTAIALGPSLGGFLTAHLGWRSIFGFTVPFGAIGLLLSILGLKIEEKRAPVLRFDYPGAVIYGLSVFLLIYPPSLLVKGIGILLFLLFLLWERRARDPILDINLLKENRVFLYSSLSSFLLYTSTFATGFLLSFYLQFIKGLGPQTAGLYILARRISQAVISPSAGRTSDRIEPVYIATLGVGIAIIGLVFLFNFRIDTGILYILITLIILGLGFGLFSAPNTSAIMGSVSKENYGIASALNATVRVVGQAMSMGVATAVIGLILGPVRITPERFSRFLQAMRSTFAIFIVVGILALFFSIRRGRLR
ncbi:MAG TPA: MFS transporter, partial [bacterium (Candidatus Stahlbacteria)]|nr:MFS transporter [Candidatus Stahlbacteria bacterium]